jgi:basic amino acid/polyamine antiporter, APA family
VLVSAAVLILRRTQPNLRRAFRVPLVPWIPILSIIASLVLIVSLPWVTLVRFVVWLAIGMVIYFLYSRHKSHLQQEVAEPNPKAFQETSTFESMGAILPYR